MAIGRVALADKVSTELPTNNARKITAVKHRDVLTEYSESKFNLEDDRADVIQVTTGYYLNTALNDIDITAELALVQANTNKDDIDTNAVAISTLTSATQVLPWVTPTLLNSWVNQAGTLQYRAIGNLSDGEIHFRGYIDDGASGSIAFNLDSLHRPSEQTIVSLSVGSLVTLNDQASAVIDTNGDVTIWFVGTSPPVSFGGVSFWI